MITKVGRFWPSGTRHPLPPPLTQNNVRICKIKAICENKTNNDQEDTFKFYSYKILPINLFSKNEDATYLNFYLQGS